MERKNEDSNKVAGVPVLYHAWLETEIWYRQVLYQKAKVYLFKVDTLSCRDSTDELKKLIDGYDPKNEQRMAVEAIHEMFLKEEVEKLKTYLGKYENTVFKYVKAKFPISKNDMCLAAFPYGGTQGGFIYHNADDYPFNFKLQGWFDLELPTSHCFYNG